MNRNQVIAAALAGIAAALVNVQVQRMLRR